MRLCCENALCGTLKAQDRSEELASFAKAALLTGIIRVRDAPQSTGTSVGARSVARSRDR
jgi:hypothetical protein